MNTTIARVIVFFGLTISSSHAQAGPEIYAATQTLLRIQEEESERRATYLGDPALFEPEPVMFARFRIDVTGDGVPETFVGATLDRNPTIRWSVYLGGSDTPVADNLEIDPRTIYLRQSQEGFIISQVNRFPDGSYGLRSYGFSSGGKTLDLSRPLTAAEAMSLRLEGVEKEKILGTRYAPETEIVLLEQFLADPNAIWRHWDRERSGFAQATESDRDTLNLLRTGSFRPREITSSPSTKRQSTDSDSENGRVLQVFRKPPISSAVELPSLRWSEIYLMIIFVSGLGLALFWVRRQKGWRH